MQGMPAAPWCPAARSHSEVPPVAGHKGHTWLLFPTLVLGACAVVVWVAMWPVLEASELFTSQASGGPVQARGSAVGHSGGFAVRRRTRPVASINAPPILQRASAAPAVAWAETTTNSYARSPLPAVMVTTALGLAAWWYRSTRTRQSSPEVVSLVAMTGKYAVFQEDQGTQDGTTETIVKNLKDRYGDLETKKVVRAWRRMQSGVVHTESHGVHPLMVQRCNLYIAGLKADPRPVWENADIAWAGVLEGQWKTIREELKKVVDMGEDGLMDTEHEGWITPNRHGASDAYGPDWKILNLVERGNWNEKSMKLFPETCRILRESEVPLMEAEFACMPAESYITPHSDGWNFMLTAHLPLILPRRSTALALNVGDCTMKWKEGELLLFDSSFLHEAYNRSQEDRYVLLLRVWHPELTSVEQQALLHLFQIMEDRFLPGGKRFTGKPPPPEMFTITIGNDTWKLPAGENTFDTRVFGPNIVLWDREMYYTACQSGTRFFVEPDHCYDLRELKNVKKQPVDPATLSPANPKPEPVAVPDPLPEKEPER